MKTTCLRGNNFTLNIGLGDSFAYIADGFFGEISIEKSPLFWLKLKNAKTGERKEIKSDDGWKNVTETRIQGGIKWTFSEPFVIPYIQAELKAANDEIGISWYADVKNDNSEWSVMEITYPTPITSAKKFNFFVPDGCGVELKDAGNRSYSRHAGYPGGAIVMQYFAVYGEDDGIYIGIEDGTGAVKDFLLSSGEGKAEIRATYYGDNASEVANSFSAAGFCRWQYIKGDWYDATLLYADFVKNRSDWLPEITKNGREDTPDRFKEIPFWVSDYIPNSPSQGNNKPMSLSAGSDTYEKNYWIDAVIKLQKELGVPIAYHVYNWHEIPFNIEYPHFLPAKDEFIKGAERLRDYPVYILPYINAGSWEMHDAEMGHKVNFENVGKYAAAVKEDGSFDIENYPQVTLNGETSLLAHLCPSSDLWHNVMKDLVKEMESELPIDGVYFDQVGAIQATPCYNKEHGHSVGGGAYWAQGYRKMMDTIRAEKPRDNFYFTENNAENFTKSFDGFLTWMWLQDGQVPAFPLVYAGYIEMIGRCTIGKKKEDYEFFKYSLAQSFLYGQQLGWCKADVVFDDKRLAFLKKLVKLRYENTELFHRSDLLRPPKTTSSNPPKTTTPALFFWDDVVMEQILAGAWKYRNGEELTVFCINISEKQGDFTLKFNAKEYGLDEYVIPEDFIIDGDVCTVSGTICAEDFKVWKLKRKK